MPEGKKIAFIESRAWVQELGPKKNLMKVTTAYWQAFPIFVSGKI